MYSFSSEKKTTLQGSFEICTPPKQSSKEKQEKHTADDGRCQLIKSILKRFKDHQNLVEAPEDCSSPSISSLKLKDRLFLGVNKGKDNDNIKFIGKRGCPLNKLSRQYLARRENG